MRFYFHAAANLLLLAHGAIVFQPCELRTLANTPAPPTLVRPSTLTPTPKGRSLCTSWPSRAGSAGRPISAPLHLQAAPRPGGTCPRPAARTHLPQGPTARVASTSFKLVPAALGGTCPRLAARFYLPPGATARVASPLIKPASAAPGDVPPARGPPPSATGRYGPCGATLIEPVLTTPGTRPRLAARLYRPPGATARRGLHLIEPVSRRPPTAARARTALPADRPRWARTTAPRDFLAGAAGLARTPWIRCEAVVEEPRDHHAAGTGWGAWVPRSRPHRHHGGHHGAQRRKRGRDSRLFIRVAGPLVVAAYHSPLLNHPSG